MKRTLFCATWLLGLSGCALEPAKPPRLEVGPVRVERVEVPVLRPCVAASEIPPLPVRTMVDPKAADVRQLAAAAAADLLAYEAYGRLADPILRACASDPPPPAPTPKPPPS